MMISGLRWVVAFGFAAVALGRPEFASAVSEQVLYSFCTQDPCGTDSAKPQLPILDNSGNLYGVEGAGGASAAGVIYKWSSSSSYQVVYSYCPQNNGQNQCQDGDGPIGSLIMDGSGNLYGVTAQGGPLAYPGKGTVYRVSPSVQTPVPIHLWEFCSTDPGCPEGSDPKTGLTYAGAANGQTYNSGSPLFGTTTTGGACGLGTVFKLTPGGSAAAIANFCSSVSNCPTGLLCLIGQTPNAVIADSTGNLFGTTQYGPSGNNAAILCKLTPSGSSYSLSVLHTFCSLQNCTDGKQPMGLLALD